MPQKNAIKRYYENAFYHIYNRGVEKRNIFQDRDDYVTFLHLLKTSLASPLQQGETLSEELTKRPRRKNFNQKIDLLSYCLMPNHFHFLIRQTDPTAISEFVRSTMTSYSMYFNKKYQRVGSLFQGVFKAVDIENENYLIWVSRYIHRNPQKFQTYPYSSYGDYIGIRQTPWINTHLLLQYFSNSRLKQQSNNYQRFVDDESQEPPGLSMLTLDTEE